jgi:hypothetical protein
VYGDAQVSTSNSICWFTGVGTEHATLTATLDKAGNVLLTRGCFCGSVDEFIARSEAQHDEDTQHEYRLLIDVAISRLNRAAKGAA